MAVQALLTPQPGPAGYLHRELLIRTPEGRRVDLLTVTDCHGVLVGAGWSSCLPFAIRETAAPGASAKGVVDKAPGEGGEGEGVRSLSVAMNVPLGHVLHSSRLDCYRFRLLPSGRVPMQRQARAMRRSSQGCSVSPQVGGNAALGTALLCHHVYHPPCSEDPTTV